MDQWAFFDEFKAGTVRNVYLFYGQEAYIRKSALATLQKKLLMPGLEDMNCTFMQSPTAQQIVENCETLPMMVAFGAMRASGLIEQGPDGRYWLGIRLFEYGCAVSNSWDISTIARPYMQSVCQTLGESVFLSVFDRANVVTLAEEESRASLRVVSEVGARLPAHCTSQGKLFLASVSQAECRRILRQAELKAYTPNTLTQPEQFTAELQRIREQGYAVENGEFKPGLRSVSAPIRNASGEVAYAFGTVGMFRQLHTDEFQQAIVLVTDAAAKISAAIGYRG